MSVGMVIIGDVNQDDSVDLLDVSPFVDRITSGEYQIEADMNEDGAVDLLDVSPFVDVLSGNAPKIAILKDTLDIQNFVSISSGGGLISQNGSNINQVDGRTHVGYEPTRAGHLKQLTLNFIALETGDSQPINVSDRSVLFDMNIAQYASFSEAEGEPTRVDMFFPESTQPQDIFDNPVGQTTESEVYQAVYDLSPQGINVTPGQTNYLGISATGVPVGGTFQPQRSDDSGIIIGPFEDFVSGTLVGPGLFPMSQFYSDSIQNSVRITMIIDE